MKQKVKKKEYTIDGQIMSDRYLEIEWLDESKFFITRQSHRENQFVPSGESGVHGWTSSNGVQMYSVSHPAIYQGGATLEGKLITLSFATQGSTRSMDKTVLSVRHPHQKKLIIDAVDEYNKKFGSVLSIKIDDSLFKI